MYEFLIDKSLEASQHSRDADSLLRLLFLECRSKLTVLDAVLDDLKTREEEPTDAQLAALAKSLSVDVLGSVFLMGPARDGAWKKLRKAKITGDDPEKAVSDSLASVFVRAQAVMRLAELRGAGLATKVSFSTRLSNLKKDYLSIVKALGSEVWST